MVALSRLFLMNCESTSSKSGSETARHVRSYVRRAGRITPAQRSALDGLLREYAVPSEVPFKASEVFGREAPCWLEVSFGDGDNLIALASQHPEIDFVGLEVHTPGIGRLLRGVQEHGLTNVRVQDGDAVMFLRDQCPNPSFDRILLLFPDPWPKKRHHKRRILQPEFAKLVSEKLRDGGVFHAATDWQPYAEFMLEVLEDEPTLINASSSGYSVSAEERIETKFERRGLRLGHDVWDLIYTREAASSKATS